MINIERYARKQASVNSYFLSGASSINDGKDTITGRFILNDRAIGPEAQEHIPTTENIRTLRGALNTLGEGFVEAIDDATLIAIAEKQPEVTDGKVHGEVMKTRISATRSSTLKLHSIPFPIIL